MEDSRHGLHREIAKMPLHSAWKGYLKVSLVSIPLRAVTASNGDAPQIRLNQLHKKCKSRIKYRKTCPIHGEVPNDEIVSGFEFSKGRYVVIDPDEVEKLRPQGDKSLSLDSFVPAAAIDPLYLAGQAYYLLPDGEVGQKAYSLLQKALVTESLQGVGTVVISRRQRLVRVRPVGQILSMEVLQHEAEVQRPEQFDDEVTAAKSTAQELKLTRSLLSAMTRDEFDPSAYKDTYIDELQELIDAKVEGREIVTHESVESRPVINLMDALKASMKQVKVPVRTAKEVTPMKKKGKRARTRKASPVAAARATKKTASRRSGAKQPA
jgi:DNA end-binding protein Ku